jgi:hypothetical protein
MAILTRHWKLAILWGLSLVVVSVISSSAQGRRGQPTSGFELLTVAPTIVSGNDVGFRIERTQDGMPVGKVVVRVDGRWVDTLTPRN